MLNGTFEPTVLRRCSEFEKGDNAPQWCCSYAIHVSVAHNQELLACLLRLASKKSAVIVAVCKPSSARPTVQQGPVGSNIHLRYLNSGNICFINRPNSFQSDGLISRVHNHLYHLSNIAAVCGQQVRSHQYWHSMCHSRSVQIHKACVYLNRL